MKPARGPLAALLPLVGRPLFAILLSALLLSVLAPALTAAPGARIPLALYPADAVRAGLPGRSE
jgi:hypothetical protein